MSVSVIFCLHFSVSYVGTLFLIIWKILHIFAKLKFLHNKKRNFNIGAGKATASVCRAVLWIDIVLMPIRIRISMLMPIRIRIRISILMPIRIRMGIKTLQIHMRFLPQVLHITHVENQNFFVLLSQHV
jgi:hypothetical protein